MLDLMTNAVPATSDRTEANMPVSEQPDDFVVLDDAHVAWPSRQLILSSGRFDLNTGGTQMVAVYFDREMKADRLMIPASESPYYIAPSDPAAPVPLIPFISRQQRKLFEFGFSNRLEGNTMIFFLNYEEEIAYSMLRELARLPKHASRDRPSELMGQLLAGIARLREWPVDEVRDGWVVKRVELRVSRRFVKSIERETELGLAPASATEDLLAAWEVAQ